MLDDLKEYKPYDALDLIETSAKVFMAVVGAFALLLIGYGFVVVLFSL